MVSQDGIARSKGKQQPVLAAQPASAAQPAVSPVATDSPKNITDDSATAKVKSLLQKSKDSEMAAVDALSQIEQILNGKKLVPLSDTNVVDNQKAPSAPEQKQGELAEKSASEAEVPAASASKSTDIDQNQKKYNEKEATTASDALAAGWISKKIGELRERLEFQEQTIKELARYVDEHLAAIERKLELISAQVGQARLVDDSERADYANDGLTQIDDQIIRNKAYKRRR